MLTKEKVLHVINRLPATFSMDEILDELLLIQKIETGLSQSKKNEVTEDKDLDKELPKWLG